MGYNPKWSIREVNGLKKFRAVCHDITAKQGVFKKNEILKQFQLVEDLKFKGLCKFKTNS